MIIIILFCIVHFDVLDIETEKWNQPKFLKIVKESKPEPSMIKN
jgi:hypothetical protein